MTTRVQSQAAGTTTLLIFSTAYFSITTACDEKKIKQIVILLQARMQIKRYVQSGVRCTLRNLLIHTMLAGRIIIIIIVLTAFVCVQCT